MFLFIPVYLYQLDVALKAKIDERVDNSVENSVDNLVDKSLESSSVVNFLQDSSDGPLGSINHSSSGDRACYCSEREYHPLDMYWETAPRDRSNGVSLTG